jgi:2-oxoglutarate dehydrogenase E1 component
LNLGLEDQIVIDTVEQICPFPFDIAMEECQKYDQAEVVWCQEEHKNQGAWNYVQPRFQTALGGYNRRMLYCGREVNTKYF